MRSYPIYHMVATSDYKSSKSYGTTEHATTGIYVGTSSKNSEPLVKHETERTVDGEYTVFTFGVDLLDGAGMTPIKRKWMHTKRREWFDTKPAELS